jgi:hypothetical protein
MCHGKGERERDIAKERDRERERSTFRQVVKVLTDIGTKRRNEQMYEISTDLFLKRPDPNLL